MVRRFLGAFYPPAMWERVERVTEVEGERFRSRSRHLREPGWRAVLPASAADDRTVDLRPLVPGSSEVTGVTVRSGETEIAEEETKPPARITESRLLYLMENAGKQI